jgi:hypothetical protein
MSKHQVRAEYEITALRDALCNTLLNLPTVFGLFHTLLEMGHCKEGRWKTHLDEKLHTFAGNYHKLATTDPYRFASHEGNIIMQMAPPQATMKASTV